VLNLFSKIRQSIPDCWFLLLLQQPGSSGKNGRKIDINYQGHEREAIFSFMTFRYFGMF